MSRTRSTSSVAALALAALVAFAALLLSASPATAWPNNAGTVCSTSSSDINSIAMSRHGSAGSGGYSVSAVSANSGSGYQVTISGGSSYTGIVLLARDASGNLVGSFTGYPSGLSAKTDCGGPAGSILEHNSASRKSLPLTVTWSAGSSSVSDGSQITFEAIVVQTTRSWSVASAGSIVYAASGSSSSGSDNSAATTQAAAATTQTAPTATQSGSDGITRTNIAVPTGTNGNGSSRPTGSMSGTRPTDFPGSNNNSTGSTGGRPSGGHGHHDGDGDSSSSSSSGSSSSGSGSRPDGDGDGGSSSSTSASTSNDHGSSSSPASNSNSAASGTSNVASSQQSSTSTSTSPNPAVVGAAVGAGIACAGAIGGLAFFLSRRNKKSKDARERAMESATNLAPSAAALDAQLGESAMPVGYEVDYQAFAPKSSYLAEGDEYPSLAMQSSGNGARV